MSAVKRLLVNLHAINTWDINGIGIDYEIPAAGGEYDITAIIPDSELMALVRYGALVLSADNVLRVETDGVDADISSNAAVSAITQILITDFTNAAHDHVDAAGGGQLVGKSALSDILPATGGGTDKVVATDSSGNVDFGSGLLKSSATPAVDEDVVNVAYVKARIEGLDPKGACVAATTNVLDCAYVGTPTFTLTCNVDGLLVMDDYEPAVGDRVLVKDESIESRNGIFTVLDTGSVASPFILQRAEDFDSSEDITYGAYTVVINGTDYEGTGFIVATPDPIVLDTSDILWTYYSLTTLLKGGTGLTRDVNTLNVGDGTVEKRGGIDFQADDIAAATDADTIQVNVSGELYCAKAPIIGQLKSYFFGRRGPVPDDSDLKCVDNIFSGDSTYRMGRACAVTMIAVQCSSGPGTSVDVEVWKNGSLLHSSSVASLTGAAVGLVVRDTMTNSRFIKDDLLSVRINNLVDTRPEDMVVEVEVRVEADPS